MKLTLNKSGNKNNAVSKAFLIKALNHTAELLNKGYISEDILPKAVDQTEPHLTQVMDQGKMVWGVMIPEYSFKIKYLEPEQLELDLD